MNPVDPIDVLANAIAERLKGRLPGGLPSGPDGPDWPGKEPVLERPPLFEPPFEIEIDGLRQRRLRIAGIELTQSIQHHGAAGASYGDDNSVPLVALKPLVARVYPM